MRPNPPVETLDEFEFFPPLNDACQNSTIFSGGRPLGTLIRKHVIDRGVPVWTLYDTDAGKVREFWLAPTYERLAKQSTEAISRYYGIRTK